MKEKIKESLNTIWDKIKQSNVVIIMYLMLICTYFMMLSVVVISDVFFGGFNPIKYIAYAVVLFVLVIVMIKYKDEVKDTINKSEYNINNSIIKQYILNKGNNKAELIYNLSNLQKQIKKDIINNLDNINKPKVEIKITDEKN